MHTFFSGKFSDLEGLSSEYNKLKISGMSFIGLPERLLDKVAINQEGLILYELVGGTKKRILARDLAMMKIHVMNNHGDYCLSLTV